MKPRARRKIQRGSRRSAAPNSGAKSFRTNNPGERPTAARSRGVAGEPSVGLLGRTDSASVSMTGGHYTDKSHRPIWLRRGARQLGAPGMPAVGMLGWSEGQPRRTCKRAGLVSAEFGSAAAGTYPLGTYAQQGSSAKGSPVSA